jgi:nucleoside-diphosphate-sugar epimerase
MVNGERDYHRRLERYLYRMIDGGPVIVPDGGTHIVRHVYAGEVARFLVEVLGRHETFGEAYNVCQREMPALSEFLGLVGNQLGGRAKLVPVGWADIKEAGLDPLALSPFSGSWMSILDPTKAESELGFRHEPLSVYVGKIVASFCAYARATPPEGYELRPAEIALAERWLKERESVRPPPSMRFS